ncbi:MAG: hypothetical protein ACRD37_10385, partial [Candidatus Acidiferrales bacterium]
LFLSALPRTTMAAHHSAAIVAGAVRMAGQAVDIRLGRTVAVVALTVGRAADIHRRHPAAAGLTVGRAAVVVVPTAHRAVVETVAAVDHARQHLALLAADVHTDRVRVSPPFPSRWHRLAN